VFSDTFEFTGEAINATAQLEHKAIGTLTTQAIDNVESLVTAAASTSVAVGLIGVGLLGTAPAAYILALDALVLVVSFILYDYVRTTTESSYQISHLFGDMLDVVAAADAFLAFVLSIVGSLRSGLSPVVRIVFGPLAVPNALEAGADIVLVVGSGQ
jgi:hypothetical protein